MATMLHTTDSNVCPETFICKHYFKMNIYWAEASLLDYPYIIY